MSINKKVEYKDETIYLNGKMLVGQDLFNYVFDKELRKKIEREPCEENPINKFLRNAY